MAPKAQDDSAAEEQGDKGTQAGYSMKGAKPYIRGTPGRFCIEDDHGIGFRESKWVEEGNYVTC